MKFLKIFMLSALALLFVGCAGYRVGSTLPESIQTVGLIVKNQSGEPSIEVAVMKALRAELQMDGRLAVVSPDDSPDTLLKVTLNSYDLDPLAYDSEDGTRASEYRMVIYGSTVFSNAKTDEVIQESPELIGEEDFLFSSDLTSAKRSGLSAAASDLARKVVSVTVMVW